VARIPGSAAAEAPVLRESASPGNDARDHKRSGCSARSPHLPPPKPRRQHPQSRVARHLVVVFSSSVLHDGGSNHTSGRFWNPSTGIASPRASEPHNMCARGRVPDRRAAAAHGHQAVGEWRGAISVSSPGARLTAESGSAPRNRIPSATPEGPVTSHAVTEGGTPTPLESRCPFHLGSVPGRDPLE
jgi:hypothetical protein